MIPTWVRRDGFVHLSYELPYRVHAAEIYPIRAPNGSTIIINGHANGLTIIWRGGRPFKSKLSSSIIDRGKSSSSNARLSSTNNSIMIIDSDDDELRSQSQDMKANHTFPDTFEPEEPEYDLSQPYDRVVNTFDVPGVDVAVLGLAVPPVAPYITGGSHNIWPSILERQIVLVAACADASIRLLTVPLMPFREDQPQQTKCYWIAKSRLGPRNIPLGISATWTSRSPETNNWTLLIASHSSEAGGLFSLYQCSLAESGSIFVEDTIASIREEYLPGPATCISFSSANYPSERHSQLLLADAKGVIRIYDPFPRKVNSVSRGTQNLDMEVNAHRGSWLASLSTPFKPSKSIASGIQMMGEHGKILDTKWVYGGKSIVVLLADGQWGIWDIEGISPPPANSAHQNDDQVHGREYSVGSTAHFALRGFIGDSVDARAAGFTMDDGRVDGPNTSHADKDSQKLAPMTPNTRKVKQQSLFSGSSRSSLKSNLVRGGISVSNSTDSPIDTQMQERVVFWLGTSIFVISSLAEYRQRVANTGTRALDGMTLSGPSIPQLNALSTAGEFITGVTQAPQVLDNISSTSTTVQAKLSRSASQADILVSAENRLIILCPANRSRSQVLLTRSKDSRTHKHATAGLDEEDVTLLDHDLLSRGDLDIGGIERMLDGMSGRDTHESTANHEVVERGGLFTASKRKVGFVSGV